MSHPKATAKARPTKTAVILRLLKRPAGASVAEIAKLTGWQSHSIRGFLSGTVKNRLGLTIVREQNAKGVQRYRIVATKAA